MVTAGSHRRGLPGNELLDQPSDVLQGEAGRVGKHGQVHGPAVDQRAQHRLRSGRELEHAPGDG